MKDGNQRIQDWCYKMRNFTYVLAAKLLDVPVIAKYSLLAFQRTDMNNCLQLECYIQPWHFSCLWCGHFWLISYRTTAWYKGDGRRGSLLWEPRLLKSAVPTQSGCFMEIIGRLSVIMTTRSTSWERAFNSSIQSPHRCWHSASSHPSPPRVWAIWAWTPLRTENSLPPGGIWFYLCKPLAFLCSLSFSSEPLPSGGHTEQVAHLGQGPNCWHCPGHSS